MWCSGVHSELQFRRYGTGSIPVELSTFAICSKLHSLSYVGETLLADKGQPKKAYTLKGKKPTKPSATCQTYESRLFGQTVSLCDLQSVKFFN